MRPHALAGLALALQWVAACAAAPAPAPEAGPGAPPEPIIMAPPPRPPDAMAMLRDRNGVTIGQASFHRAPRGVLMFVTRDSNDVRLSPGFHGLHLHAKGDCSAPTFQSAGPHANHDEGTSHGLLGPNPEAGDLPNLWVFPDGGFHAQIFTSLVTLDQLLDADGSSLVIHANLDDQLTQPIGGAGDRVACGVLHRSS